MFFNNLQNNQTAANVDQQSTIKITPESTVCVELSDEESCAVNGGLQAADNLELEILNERIKLTATVGTDGWVGLGLNTDAEVDMKSGEILF